MTIWKQMNLWYGWISRLLYRHGRDTCHARNTTPYAAPRRAWMLSTPPPVKIRRPTASPSIPKGEKGTASTSPLENYTHRCISAALEKGRQCHASLSPGDRKKQLLVTQFHKKGPTSKPPPERACTAASRTRHVPRYDDTTMARCTQIYNIY